MPTVALYGAIRSILTSPVRALVTVTFQWVNYLVLKDRACPCRDERTDGSRSFAARRRP